MSKTKTRKSVERVGGLILPIPEEEAEIHKGIAADPDTFEFTDEQFKKARRGWQTRANEALRKAAGL